MPISDNDLNEVRSRNDIVSVVSKYVTIKKRGKNYLGLCPFHSEKTPSFTVSPDKQMYYCFGCHEGGNVFHFVMKIENLGFGETVQKLAEEVGITITASKSRSEDTPEIQKARSTISLAVKFFHNLLMSSPKAESARKAAAERGLTRDTLIGWQIGYAPGGWDTLIQYFTDRGGKIEDLESVGLVVKREDGSGFFDRFRERLIFPIFDARGQAIALGGRAIDSTEPKYLNSPETILFNKSVTLFGYDKARKNFKTEGGAVVVEGYIDVITCHQAGFPQVVGPLGTALTEDHVRILRRSTPTVTLAFDADHAGMDATERSVGHLRAIGVDVRVADFSETGVKDPDELIRKQGAQKFRDILNAAKPWLAFTLTRLQSQATAGPSVSIEQRVAAARKGAVYLAQEQDALIRQEYIKTFARGLALDPVTLEDEVKRHLLTLSSPLQGQRRRFTPMDKPVSRLIKAERFILRWLVEDHAALSTVKLDLAPEHFSDEGHRQIAQALWAIDGNLADNTPLAHRLIDEITDTETRTLFSELLVSEETMENPEETLRDCLAVLKTEKMRRQMDQLKTKISAAEGAGNLSEVTQLTQEYHTLNQQMRLLTNPVRIDLKSVL